VALGSGISQDLSKGVRIKRSGESAPLAQEPINLKDRSSQGTPPETSEAPAPLRQNTPTLQGIPLQGLTRQEMQMAAKLYQWEHAPPKKILRGSHIIEPGNFIQHDVLGQVFKKYVTKSGWVNYRGLKRDKKAQKLLKNYIEDLIKIDPSTLENPMDRLASWLNLYNALVIDDILKHYPVKSLMQIKNFFGEKRFKIGEEEYSLLDIEKKIFLDQMREPRAVFARVNGATSGPRLSKKPFSAIKIEKQLEERTWKFLMDRSNVDFDPHRQMLILNPTFLWYQEEIVDLPAFLHSYLDLLPSYYQVSYSGYDWKLNDEKLH